MNPAFNARETSVVGYVNSNGEVRNAIVNGVNEETGNPNLAVIKQVPDAQFDANRAPGTWHYLDAEPVAEAPVVEESAPVDETPVGEGEGEPA